MQAPLRLYYNPMCMFCHKMLERLQKDLPEVPIQLVDVTSDPIAINGLVTVTGKNAVPVLVDIAHATPESTPILSGFVEDSVAKLISDYRAQLSAIKSSGSSNEKPVEAVSEAPAEAAKVN